jgi:hypothetical protein
MATVVTCDVIIEAHYTKSIRVRPAIKTFVKVRKLSLVMIISTCLHVWWGKMWETSLYMWAPLSDAITTMVSWNVSWAIVHSLPHGQHSKWILKSSMVWPHWHHERCKTIGCRILKQIWNVVRKWAEDKRNER